MKPHTNQCNKHQHSKLQRAGLMQQRVGVMQQQRGATLVVSMIMLLLLTLIGVAGMRDTMLQEKMAGNLRDRELALQAAEAALRQGELAAKTQAVWGIPGYEELTAMPVRLEQSYWSPASYSWTSSNSVVYTGTLNDVSQPPRFVVEKLPTTMSDQAPSVSKFAGGGGSAGMVTSADLGTRPHTVSRQDYRITAIGWGITGTAAVVLQSTYWR